MSYKGFKVIPSIISLVCVGEYFGGFVCFLVFLNKRKDATAYSIKGQLSNTPTVNR